MLKYKSYSNILLNKIRIEEKKQRNVNNKLRTKL
jgi:hypothetical protein